MRDCLSRERQLRCVCGEGGLQVTYYVLCSSTKNSFPVEKHVQVS